MPEIEQFDVVVVGSGGAGLTAATTAAVKGLRVAVLEKTDVYGGTTAISGGGVWIPDNHLAAAGGVADSADNAMTYLRHCAGACLDEQLASAFVAAGPEMLQFLERETEVKFSYAAGRPDYRPALPGAAAEGRTIHPLPFDARALGGEVKRLRLPSKELTFLGMMIKPGPELKHFLNVFRSAESTAFVVRKLSRHFRDVALHGQAMDLSNGNALIGRLALSGLRHGARIFTNASATALLREGNRVVGVTADTPAGPKTFGAKRGVVLATGGFAHDHERQRQFFPHVRAGKDHHSPGTEGVTGDGLRLAQTAGAKIGGNVSQAACWAPVSKVPQADGSTITIPHLIDRQKPGFIAVTRHGKRFVNEASSYHDFGQAMIEACSDDAEAVVFLVTDHRAMRRYGIGGVKPAPIPFGRHLRSGYLMRGQTIAGLAIAAGIDPVALDKTVAHYNRAAAKGEDPAFGKGANIYNRYNGDPAHAPNPCLAPIQDGPFYCLRLYVGELGTLTGLVIDTHARVLDEAGNPVPGLYAAGNDATNVMGGDYVSGGTTLGPGMVFGYLAACHMKATAERDI